MNPSVSVVVPVRNRQDLIVRCLDSIWNQTVKPFELIVVDNDSSDNTYKAVEEWIQAHSGSHVRMKLLKEKKRGAYAARQTGLEIAEGEYVSFFDSDDEMKPNLVEQAWKAVITNSKPDIVCWQCVINMLDGSKRIPSYIPDRPLESHLIHTMLRPQGYMVKKDFISLAGGWKKPLEVWDDMELGLRLLLREPSIVALKDVLAEIYAQENSITGTDFSSKEGKWEITLDEMFSMTEKSNHPSKARIKNILDYRRSILAASYSREGNDIAAAKLMDKALGGKDFIKKQLLRFSFNYTKHGMRGAWRIVGKAF